jgi:ribosome-binding factor A
LRREIAAVLLNGEVRDPRIAHGANVAITGVQVTNDLSQARVFVDVLAPERDRMPVLAALKASANAIRVMLNDRIALRRIPKLLFEYDESVARGVKIERILAEMRSEHAPPDASDEVSGSDSDDGDAP